MPETPRINVYGNRGQGLVLVLYSLRELGGVCTKQGGLLFVPYREDKEIPRPALPPLGAQNGPALPHAVCWGTKGRLKRGGAGGQQRARGRVFAPPRS